MECRKIAELIPLAVGGELVPSVAERVRRHIEGCSDCRVLWDSQTAAFEALRAVFATEREETDRLAQGLPMSREVMDKLEMGCALASRLAALAAGRELPVPTMRRLQWHCDQCPKCREEVRKYASLRETCAAVGPPASGAFDDAAAFWADLEPQLEREAILAASTTTVAVLPARTTRLSVVRFWATAAALLLFGLFAGLQLGTERLFMSSEADRPSAATGVAGENKGTETAVLPPVEGRRTEAPVPDIAGPEKPLVARAGVSDRLPRMTPVGASNVPFALGSLQGERKGKSNAIQIILLPSGTSGGFEIEQIKIVPQDSRRPRKF